MLVFVSVNDECLFRFDGFSSKFIKFRTTEYSTNVEIKNTDSVRRTNIKKTVPKQMITDCDVLGFVYNSLKF